MTTATPSANSSLARSNKRHTQSVLAKWRTKTKPTAEDARLAEQCDISPVTAAILRMRGFATAEAVHNFLEPCHSGLHDPLLLPDIEPAIARLHKAITEKEPILVYGDYDVDGVTSTALLMRSLCALGATVDCRIPERKGEGYGLNVNAIEEAAAQGVKLIITADCGIRDIEPAQRAKELGLDLIITDHHEPGSELPEALAVIDPKRADSKYPFTELSGCGVAFKVMLALLKQHYEPRFVESFFSKFVDLAGMAAVADCVPLVDENRIIAREGLRRLAKTGKLGLLALMQVSRMKITGDSLRGSHVGFSLAPRLNAAGRLDSALKSLQLLLSTDKDECAALAQELEDHNLARRELQNRIVNEVSHRVENEIDLTREFVIVLAGEGWHGGVMGLVAGRMAERYSRPALVFNIENGIATGSGRTSAGFNLHHLVEAARGHILKGGGHEAACGMSLEHDKWDEFRALVLSHAAQHLTHEDLIPVVEADCEVTARDLTMQLARDLEKLEPCGQGNPEARLMLRNVKISDGRSMGGNGEHLKWTLESDGLRLEAVWWRPGERANGFGIGKTIDLCFVPEINEWNGNQRLQLVIKEARPK